MLMDYEYSEAPDMGPKRRRINPILTLVAIIVAGGFFLQSTLAANISLNSGGAVEFGQGMSLTAACSGANILTVTPNSSFINASGAGAYYLNSITVSGVPSSCNGVDFKISAYDSTTSTALPIFGSTKSVATIWNNAGTFQGGSGYLGSSITSGSGTFTVTFTSPAALASSVAKLTLQSGAHAAYSCANDLICNVGDTSGSGGIIFYKSVSAFTETGTACSTDCHYLEWAPNTWLSSTADSPTKNFYQGAGPTYAGSISTRITALGVGTGYNNTAALITAGDIAGAPTAARSYIGPLGNTVGQWFIPSKDEAMLMRNSTIYASGGFFAHLIQTSSQDATGNGNPASTVAKCWSVNFDPAGSAAAYEQGCWPNNPFRSRAIRAF